MAKHQLLPLSPRKTDFGFVSRSRADSPVQPTADSDHHGDGLRARADPPLVRPRWEIVPEVLLTKVCTARTSPGYGPIRESTEDVYAPEFRPDPALVHQWADSGNIIVTVRPPANEAPLSQSGERNPFVEFMKRVAIRRSLRSCCCRRYSAGGADSNELARMFKMPSNRAERRGEWLNLLWHSDLVVSGGGTNESRGGGAGRAGLQHIPRPDWRSRSATSSEGRLTMIERLRMFTLKLRSEPAARSSARRPCRAGPGRRSKSCREIVKLECCGICPWTSIACELRMSRKINCSYRRSSPNFMKVAPLISVCSARRTWKAKRRFHSNTGWSIRPALRRKNVRIFFGELASRRPDINLEVGSGSHAVQTANQRRNSSPSAEQEKPDWVRSSGDVNSTMGVHRSYAPSWGKSPTSRRPAEF